MSGGTFAIDFRSLRVFRAGLGAFLLLDLFFRFKDFTSLHTDSGVLPARLLDHGISLFLLSDTHLWAVTLFAAMAACGVLLILDVRPRLVSILAFVLALSLRNRNPFMSYSGDDLFRLALLWSAFLPSGPRVLGEKNFVNPAALAVFVQVFALYFCAGMHKELDAWWEDGRATFLALNSVTYARPQAAFLLGYPTLLTYASGAVLVLERLGWLLFFSPWRHAEFRILGCFVLAAMHLSFGFLMRLELFPLIDSTLLVLLLPSEFWDRLGVRAAFTPVPAPTADRYLAPVALALVTVVAAINISHLPQFDRRLWRPLRQFTAYTGLNQAWSMFTPIDQVTNAYHRLIATSPDGRKVDLLNERELTQFPTRPVNAQGEQRGFRWTRYLDAIVFHEQERYRQRLLEFFCKDRPGWRAEWFYFSEQTIAVPGVRPLQDSAVILSRICD